MNGAYSSTNPTFQSFNATNRTYWDAAAGLSLSGDFGYNHKFYVGAAYFHFNQPKVAFSALNDIRLNAKLSINGGISLSTGDYDQLTLYGDFFVQGGNKQLQGGAVFRRLITEVDEDRIVALSAGVFYRWNDALVPMLKLDYLQWGVGFSYDANMSQLRTASTFRGGFEITLSYKSFLNYKNGTAQRFRCPVPFW